MRLRMHYMIAVIIASGLTFNAFSQVPNVDSLQKKILESVQQNLQKEGLPKSFFDTLKFSLGEFPTQLDKILKEVNKSLAGAMEKGDIDELEAGYHNLSTIDSMRGDYKSAYENYKLYTLYRDSLKKKETETRALQAKMQYEFDKKQAIAKAEQEKKDAEAKRIKNIQYFTIAGLAILVLVILLIALIQWKNNKQKKKANTLLQLEKEKVESTLSDLKSTQSQLIHAEKMASLGELTAGIAHEIQNPLNFVNNFSEVNTELVEEADHEMDKANFSHVKKILLGIKENEQKINHHGKRADAIVKAMLQHTRQTSGTKEPTDINALADEYLRLAYHGLRAKDKDFTAEIKKDFGQGIGKINIIPQEIGRVLLNLYNNAFYAVNERAKEQTNGYKPTVTITTKRKSNAVELTVKDNGYGIPPEIVDKIFQPFFTTKPAGQGTGLGLSLSYDVIKAHGGDIKAQTKEGLGTEFIMVLPS